MYYEYMYDILKPSLFWKTWRRVCVWGGKGASDGLDPALCCSLGVSKDAVYELLRGKVISNIFSFRGRRTIKPKSRFILKNLIFYSKLKGSCDL